MASNIPSTPASDPAIRITRKISSGWLSPDWSRAPVAERSCRYPERPKSFRPRASQARPSTRRPRSSGHTDENTRCRADPWSQIGNYVQHADDQPDHERVMNRKTEHEQAERNDQRHDRRLGDDAGEIADQQMGHRVKRPGDVGLVLFREHDDDHIRKQVTFFQEEKGNERNGESGDHRIADRRNDRREPGY